MANEKKLQNHQQRMHVWKALKVTRKIVFFFFYFSGHCFDKYIFVNLGVYVSKSISISPRLYKMNNYLSFTKRNNWFLFVSEIDKDRIVSFRMIVHQCKNITSWFRDTQNKFIIDYQMIVTTTYSVYIKFISTQWWRRNHLLGFSYMELLQMKSCCWMGCRCIRWLIYDIGSS